MGDENITELKSPEELLNQHEKEETVFGVKIDNATKYYHTKHSNLHF